MKPIRVGVVGVGYMGRRHALKVRALSQQMSGVELAGVADIDIERAREVSLEVSAPYYDRASALHPHTDAVVVAVPTVAHRAVVHAALAAGLDVLVEKPIAADLEEGEGLLAIARDRGRILQVGHIEWFNAAIPVIRENIRSPHFVEAHRLGSFTNRATDVDVVRDLMIHDLDIVQRLLGEEPEFIDAIGLQVVSDKVDLANARISYPGGCVANFTASRVSTSATRTLRFFQNDGFFSIDFLAQSAAVYRRAETLRPGAPRIEMEELKVDPEDALMAQLRSFAEAVATRRPPTGSGDDGLGALRSALRVVEAMPDPRGAA